MAEYSNFEDLFSSVSNATCLINGSQQDEGTYTVAFSDFNFYYNNNKVTSFYASGNGWIGIGSSNESYSLKVNRRDMSMYYLYKESATVKGKKVFRLKWKGVGYWYTKWSNDTANDALIYDVAFVENGDIVLNVSKIPTTNVNPATNYNGLWISSQIASFTLTEPVPIIKTFTPSNLSGTSFTVSDGYPVYINKYHLIRSENNIYNITNNVLTMLNVELSKSTFETYGTSYLPDYNLYSSLKDPEILLYTDDSLELLPSTFSIDKEADESTVFDTDSVILNPVGSPIRSNVKVSQLSYDEDSFGRFIVHSSQGIKILLVTTHRNAGSNLDSETSYSYKNNQWIVTDDIVNDGMSPSEFNSIPKQQWLQRSLSGYSFRIFIPTIKDYFQDIMFVSNKERRHAHALSSSSIMNTAATFSLLTCFYKPECIYTNQFNNCNLIQNFRNFESTWTFNNSSIDSLFRNCSRLTHINTDSWSNITNMRSAFNGCTTLANMPTIPNGVIDISDIFSNCYSLKNVSTIPNSVVNMSYSFMDCTTLVEAPSIPNGVVEMYGTFYGCKNLVDAPNIPDSVRSMGRTFFICTNLVNAPTLGNGVESLSETFQGCTNLVNAPNIPDSVTSMYATFQTCQKLVNPPILGNNVSYMDNAFCGCYNLISTPQSFPNTVTSMGRTFSGCSNIIYSADIPDNVTYMFQTFGWCTNLVNAPKIGNSVNYMYETFIACTNLVNTPTIPNGVDNMYGTFEGCTNLVHASAIPNSVVNMCNTFRNCANLVDIINVPELVTNMVGTFSNCHSLQGDMYIYANSVTNCYEVFYGRRSSDPLLNVYMYQGEPTYNVFNTYFQGGTTNQYYNIVVKTMEPVYPARVVFTDFAKTRFPSNYGSMETLPDETVNKLTNACIISNATNAFLDCTNLRSLSNVEQAWNMQKCDNTVNMFRNCRRLSSVNTTNWVFESTNVNASYMFSGCNSLQSVPTIPTGVTNMFLTFENCFSLINAPIIPNSVVNMTNTFYNCIRLKNVPIIPNSVVNMTNTFHNCTNLVNAPNIPDSVVNMESTFRNCTNLVNAPNIPNNVNSLYSTFSNCFNLVNVPNISCNITTMWYTFQNCTNLVNAPEMPDSVTSMFYTFFNCTNLENVNLPNNVVSLSYVFMNSGLINTPEIPRSVNNISDLFANCYRLKNVLNIPNSVTSMFNTFYNCTNLVNVAPIPDSVTGLFRTFYNCTNLVNAPIIPNSVTSMDSTFYGCISLLNIGDLPNSLLSLAQTFCNCTNLVNAPNIPSNVTTMQNTFQNCINLQGDIYVYSNNVTCAYGCFNGHDNSYSVNVYAHENTNTYNCFYMYLGNVVDNSYFNIHLKTF